ncbi:MAG: NCS2 family permease [Clostridia bacterium]|nr:NCS2 family permease [Clostridia bacterium]
MKNKFDKFFKISERGSNFKVEIIAGLTTFFAMAYIIFVNPDQVAAGGAGGWLAASGADAAIMGKIWNAVYVASILVAAIGTLLYAFYAKLPYAQACGLGLNSFFCTTFVAGAYFSGKDIVQGYQEGLTIILLSGILFLTLSVTGAREYIAKSLPECLKKAISAGIGLFIAFIGFQNVDLIQDNQYTLVQLFDFHGAIENSPSFLDTMRGYTTAEFSSPAMAAVLIAFIGLLLIAILEKFRVKGSVIISIGASTVLYYILTWTVPSFDMNKIGQSFVDFGEIGIFGAFKGFGTLGTLGVVNIIVLVITFCLVDMFDTIGTLYGTAAQADMLDENGDPIDVDKAMACDSIATVTGAVLGTSTCTTFVESAAGVGAGGRSGFASLVTSVCFLLCLFLSPLAAIVPSCATAPALIYVGVLMLKGFAKIDMSDISNAVPAFLTVVMMPLTYSISNGIAIGAMSYVLIKACTGKYTKKDIVVTIIAVLFAVRFVMVTM